MTATTSAQHSRTCTNHGTCAWNCVREKLTSNQIIIYSCSCHARITCACIISNNKHNNCGCKNRALTINGIWNIEKLHSPEVKPNWFGPLGVGMFNYYGKFDRKKVFCPTHCRSGRYAKWYWACSHCIHPRELKIGQEIKLEISRQAQKEGKKMSKQQAKQAHGDDEKTGDSWSDEDTLGEKYNARKGRKIWWRRMFCGSYI